MSEKVTFSFFGTKLILVLGAVATILSLMAIVIFGINPNQAKQGEFGAMQYPASLSALAAGCGDFFLFQVTKDQYAEVSDEDLAMTDMIPSHPMIVPVYGYMSVSPLADDQIRFYAMDELKTPIPMERILRTMHDNNTTVVWYEDDIPFEDYTALRSYVEGRENVLALKWQYKGVDLPLNRKIAFSRWGVSQSCSFWSDSTFDDFQKFSTDNQYLPVGEPRKETPSKVSFGYALPPLPFPDTEAE